MRKIIHIDMDAFYASIEQRDQPELRGKPVILRGKPDSRGVVATCSYEARKFGIHSAMSSSRAYKLCPQAVFQRPRFEVYKSVSEQIRVIFHEFTDLVEPLSLDEAYLDVTENKKNIRSATLIAEDIRQRIFQETGLTASAGVSFNKFLAKVASDINKPDGTKVITPKQADEFIAKLAISKFFGIGKVTAEKMKKIGINTGSDLRKLSKERLVSLFGKNGLYYFNISHGRDDRPVCTEWIRKSLGKEITLDKDITDLTRILEILEDLANQVEVLLKRNQLQGKTITLKVKYFDFTSITRSKTISQWKILKNYCRKPKQAAKRSGYWGLRLPVSELKMRLKMVISSWNLI